MGVWVNSFRKVGPSPIDFDGLVWLIQWNWFKISLRKVNGLEGFPEKKKMNEVEGFARKWSTYIMSWLIDSIEWFESFFDLVESIHLYLRTWSNGLVPNQVIPIHGDLVIFIFCHDWIDYDWIDGFGMNRIRVCLFSISNTLFWSVLIFNEWGGRY